MAGNPCLQFGRNFVCSWKYCVLNKRQSVYVKVRLFTRLFLLDYLLPNTFVCAKLMTIGNVGVSGLKMFSEVLSVLVTSGKLIWISKGAAGRPTFTFYTDVLKTNFLLQFDLQAVPEPVLILHHYEM